MLTFCLMYSKYQVNGIGFWNLYFVDIVVQLEQALASSEILVSFMEECASAINTQGAQAERASMPLAAAVADLLKGAIYFISYMV